MARGPAAAAAWVVGELPRTHPPVDPESLLVEIGTQLGWFASPEEGQELAEKWRDRFVNRLVLYLNDPRRPERSGRFAFNSSNPSFIQGACHVEVSDSNELRRSKEARRHTDDYLRLIRSLTGRQFEGVCRGVLRMLGCEDAVVTPRSNDQGIDFHGKLEMAGRLDRIYVQSAIDRVMRSFVVGQAKQVADVVHTAEIRELVGSDWLAKVGVSADEGASLRDLARRPLDPTFVFFVTTGDYSKDARNLAYQLGIVIMDGDAVATLLAEHAIADLNGDCDETTFVAWVNDQLNGS